MSEVEYVTLATGEVAGIFETHDRGYFAWSIDDDENEILEGVACGREWAIKIATGKSAARMMRGRPVAGFSVADALALDGADRGVYTKRLKALLVQSTGEPAAAFSVRGNTGTASSWIDIEGRTPRGELWIAAIFGDAGGKHSLPPTRGYRAWAAARAAGIATDGIELAAHGWDSAKLFGFAPTQITDQKMR